MTGDLSKAPTARQTMEALAAAIQEGRYELVPHLIALLDRTDRRKALPVYEAMLTALRAGLPMGLPTPAPPGTPGTCYCGCKTCMISKLACILGIIRMFSADDEHCGRVDLQCCPPPP